eukprot:gb/GECG01013833.1/.p1 GENE.gb/GECG01013833.1/~~gb/GECG01013833.1/.p1  ORF type:complete len:347 (+),score=41.70 gb/GECG01013833.1/:1-1041(+)
MKSAFPALPVNFKVAQVIVKRSALSVPQAENRLQQALPVFLKDAQQERATIVERTIVCHALADKSKPVSMRATQPAQSALSASGATLAKQSALRVQQARNAAVETTAVQLVDLDFSQTVALRAVAPVGSGCMEAGMIEAVKRRHAHDVPLEKLILRKGKVVKDHVSHVLLAHGAIPTTDNVFHAQLENIRPRLVARHARREHGPTATLPLAHVVELESMDVDPGRLVKMMAVQLVRPEEPRHLAEPPQPTRVQSVGRESGVTAITPNVLPVHLDDSRLKTLKDANSALLESIQLLREPRHVLSVVLASMEPVQGKLLKPMPVLHALLGLPVKQKGLLPLAHARHVR